MRAKMTPDEVQTANELAAGYKRMQGFSLILTPAMWAYYEREGLDMANFTRAAPIPQPLNARLVGH